jgi:hypothetical protein
MATTLVVLMCCDWCKSRMRLVVIVEYDWLVECSSSGVMIRSAKPIIGLKYGCNSRSTAEKQLAGVL